MTPEAFKLAGEALYGSRWVAEMARALSCSSRSVRRWAAGSWPVPMGVEQDVALMVATRRTELEAMAPWQSPANKAKPWVGAGVSRSAWYRMKDSGLIKPDQPVKPPRWMIDEERARLEREER